jgi:fluoroquinolone resistance protein
VCQSHPVTEPIEGRTFKHEDWYGEQLIARTYIDCTFNDIELTESSIERSAFTDCTFGGVRFNASTHDDTAFIGCTFRRCNFFDTTFTGCKMTGSTFRESLNVRPMRVLGGDWSFVALAGADLRGTSFQGVRMREVDLTGANCTDAVFADVDLSGAQLHGISFVRADLRGSDLSARPAGRSTRRRDNPPGAGGRGRPGAGFHSRLTLDGTGRDPATNSGRG